MGVGTVISFPSREKPHSTRESNPNGTGPTPPSCQEDETAQSGPINRSTSSRSSGTLTIVHRHFRDTHGPWRRGANENTNGPLRQYFPKGVDLGIFPEDYLDAVAEELNDRPRETLGYRKPSESLLEPINDSVRSEPADGLKDD